MEEPTAAPTPPGGPAASFRDSRDPVALRRRAQRKIGQGSLEKENEKEAAIDRKYAFLEAGNLRDGARPGRWSPLSPQRGCRLDRRGAPPPRRRRPPAGRGAVRQSHDQHPGGGGEAAEPQPEPILGD